ncbi:MAG: hypothetical protein HY783_08305, partial [Chloroflexi bacterium]|nr:hypothetical protein [Chloroflexota bacterium]
MNRRLAFLGPYLLLLPSILFLLVFFAWPMVQALLLAFQTPEGAFALGHVQQMAEDVAFKDVLRNTILLVLLVVPLQVTLA